MKSISSTLGTAVVYHPSIIIISNTRSNKIHNWYKAIKYIEFQTRGENLQGSFYYYDYDLVIEQVNSDEGY